MLDGVPAGSILQGGAVGILAIVVLAILTGRLVARRVLEDVRADRDARVAAAEHREENYRVAWVAANATVAEQVRQLDELLEIARTTSAAVQALPRPIERRR